jgi:hypothetical protein
MDEIHAWDQQAFPFTFFAGDDYFGNKVVVEEMMPDPVSSTQH